MDLVPDLFIKNCGQLLTIAGASSIPKTANGMDDLGIIPNGAVAIKNGNIIGIGTTTKLKRKYCKRKKDIDAGGRICLPGFVDSHTHAVFGGDRVREFIQRINGETYLKILEKGGGILSTIEQTRKLNLHKLAEISKKYLDTMLLHGTTTVEIKSGYGLDFKNELKILKAIQYLQKTHCMDIVSTFLGAHVIPPEYKTDPGAYIEYVCGMLSKVRTYASFCDVFCDEGAFTTDQSERILMAAKSMGFQLKMHTNQFKDTGGVSLAIKLGVVSADHLDIITQRDLPRLKKSQVICTLLPGVPFFLTRHAYAPARKMIKQGLSVALATDFNPGTCPSGNMQLILTLGCLMMGMTPAQSINAATINAAHALKMAHRVGSIEAGKQADIIILDIHDYNQLPYYFGTNHVTTVIKKGKVVVEQGRLVSAT